ncbi:hypothetical protein FWF89_02760 [Candidatus Saccharibacteria bacterium]|nr:hypothetical protein [Candidatus Saccharibacteria bacterium]
MTVIAFLFFIAVVIAVGVSYYSKYSKRRKSKPRAKSDTSQRPTGQPVERERPITPESLKIKADIDALIERIGINEKIDDLPIIELLVDDKIKEAAQIIAKHLRLPGLSISLEYKTEAEGKEIATIPISPDLPMYGSSRLDNYPITINLYPGHDSNPSRLIYVLAHELSHIVLASIRFVDKSKEVHERQTDLAVLLLGFATSFKFGRDDTQGTAGYLPEDDFNYAYKIYEEILDSKRSARSKAIKHARYLYDGAVSVIKTIIMFDQRLDVLKSHPETRLADKDAQAVGLLFQLVVPADEVSSLSNLLSTFEKQLKLVEKSVFYGGNSDKEIKLLDKMANELWMTANKKTSQVPSDEEIELLKKYTDKWVEK